MQRVMIVGQPGSSKSTLARKLGLRTGWPVVHITAPSTCRVVCLRSNRDTEIFLRAQKPLD